MLLRQSASYLSSADLCSLISYYFPIFRARIIKGGALRMANNLALSQVNIV